MVGEALVSTSANQSGHPSATSALKAAQYFGDELDYVMPGPTGLDRRPSRIIDLQTGRVIRP